jgi:predicted ATPase
MCFLALVNALQESKGSNIVAAKAATSALHRSGARATFSTFVAHLAESMLAANDPMEASETLREGFAFVEQSGERFWLAELHRVEGLIALAKADPDRKEAEDTFLRAIEIARAQEARVLELRAAADLARLWRDTGSPNDPRALLDPILAAIEGGEATRDVRAARALLAEIG